MKKTAKITALLLALLMLGSSAAGCSKDGTDPDSPDAKQGDVKTDGEGEVIEKPTILTGVYRGTELKLEDRERIAQIPPYVDKESGNITLITNKGEESEETDENGEVQYTYTVKNYAVTVDRDMNVIERKELATGKDEYLNSGSITKDSLCYLSQVYDENTGSSSFYINKLNLETGETATSPELNSMFTDTGRDWFYIEYLVTDADGNFYLYQEREIVVLNGDFVKQYSIQLNDWVNSMSSSPDGRVFVTQYTDGGYGLFEIDKTAHQLKTEPVYTSQDGIDNLLFGEGYDMYVSGDYGFSGINIGSEPTLLMNYLNSDVDASDFDPIAVIDKDNILVTEDIRDSENYRQALSLYKKSDDIDLSKIKVLEVAAPNGLDYDLKPTVINYNKSHSDTRINVTDYSQYNTREDYRAGITKLGTDLANGLYKPDIIIVNSYNCESIRDYVIKNNVYVDFNTILSGEPEIIEDMFGGAKRALTTSDGKMWGMTKSFEVATFLTNDPALKDKTSWTLDEMLDYNKTLPEGKVLSDELYRDVFFQSEASFFYEQFVNMDEYTCNFEDETFYKLLDFIVSLPTMEVYQQQQEQKYSQENDNRYEQYQTGKVALYSANFYDTTEWVRDQVVFNTADFSAIGYPTETGYGSMVQLDNTFVITTWCKDTAGAWNFVKSAVIGDETNRGRMGRSMNGIPAFKSIFNETCKTYIDENYVFELYFSGGASWGPRNEDEEIQSEMGEPGITAKFTQEEADEFYDLLENRTGGMITSSIPEEVMGIIGEEVSSYAAGVNTAENCAAKIQSRVSIWLSEHE